jgi:hypothetical protein
LQRFTQMLLVLLSIGMFDRLVAQASNGISDGVISLESFGPAGQGGDDTTVIQQALFATAYGHQILEIPASTQPYNVRPLFIPNNTNVIVAANVTIQALPGYTESERLLNIIDVNNVTITGTPGQSVFRMLKSEYTSSEYRHCLEIAGSNNITISGIACNDSGGDGLYIGAGAQGYSSNVTVLNSSFNNNRRQGFSLVSGRHIKISNCQFTNTSGTAPSAGIDVEPNLTTNRLEDILIENSSSIGNAGNGLMFSLVNLNYTSEPISITVANYTSEKNKLSGFYAANGHEDGTPSASGAILVNNSASTMDGEYGAVASYWDAGAASLTFQNLKVLNANQSRTNIDNAAVAVKRGGGDASYMGNVHFVGTSIIDTMGNMDVYFTVWDWSHVGIKEVQFVNPVQLSGAARGTGLYRGKPTMTVNISNDEEPGFSEQK